MIEITIAQEVPLPPEWLSRLEAAARHVLTSELGVAAGRCSVGLTIVGPGRMRDLNASWRGEDRPTDVLSFATDSAPDGPEGPPVELGDVVLSPACVAPGEGGDALDGLVLCTVHGVLHLLGYDHAAVDEERVMFELQDRYTSEVRGL